MKKLSKLARIAGLCLLVSPALTTFADPPAPQPCGCEYCSHTASTKSCVNPVDGTTMTCGYFLAITTCLPNG